MLRDNLVSFGQYVTSKTLDKNKEYDSHIRTWKHLEPAFRVKSSIQLFQNMGVQGQLFFMRSPNMKAVYT